MKRILSGIRATGRLHLGNYLGAVKGMLQLQKSREHEAFFMVVDLHTMTTPYDASTLSNVTREVVLDYLASGLDPEKSTIFIQSQLADLHSELMFYCSTVVTIARMQHLPTFKDKIKQHPKSATMALLNYPILMAADILMYRANLVPVGIDQEPHLEVTREIARKMNERYGMDFPEPQRFATSGEYVPSLTGEGKMSKSVEGSYIQLTDDLNIVKQKIAAIPTDIGTGTIEKRHPGSVIKSSKMYLNTNREESLGTVALMTFVELFQGISKRQEYEKQYVSTGIRYKSLKDELAQAIYTELKPIQEKRKELEKNPDYVDQAIKQGAKKARAVASQTVVQLRARMGLV